ncbi:MAG: aquaporin [Bifidobacteriaceae bacterium]|nr:aquaporin [Bifidobacteriaceae bacterium]
MPNANIIQVFNPDDLKKPEEPRPLTKLYPLSSRIGKIALDLEPDYEDLKQELERRMLENTAYKPQSWTGTAREKEAIRLYRDLYKDTFEGKLDDVYPETVVLAAGIAHKRQRDHDLPELIDKSDEINYLAGNYEGSPVLAQLIKQAEDEAIEAARLKREAAEKAAAEARERALIEEQAIERARLEAQATTQEPSIPSPIIAQDETTLSTDNEIITDPHIEPESEFSRPLLDRAVAELFGTFLVCFIAMFASAMSPLGFGVQAVLVVPLIIGLSYALGFFVFHPVSGGYLNPAITVAQVITRKLPTLDTLVYLAMEFLGGILAGGILKMILPTTQSAVGTSVSTLLMQGFAANGYGAGTPLEHYSTLTQQANFLSFDLMAAIFFELIAIIIITMVFLRADRLPSHSSSPAILVGFSYLIGVAITYVASGSALNPARALGAALFAQDWSGAFDGSPLSQVWVFIAVPIVGALAVAIVPKLFEVSAETEDDQDYDDHYFDQDETPEGTPDLNGSEGQPFVDESNRLEPDRLNNPSETLAQEPLIVPTAETIKTQSPISAVETSQIKTEEIPQVSSPDLPPATSPQTEKSQPLSLESDAPTIAHGATSTAVSSGTEKEVSIGATPPSVEAIDSTQIPAHPASAQGDTGDSKPEPLVTSPIDQSSESLFDKLTPINSEDSSPVNKADSKES